mgnify:CR=1 FL=1
MTVGSFLILSRQRDLSPARSAVGQMVFSLPAGFRVDKFIRSVIGFTLVIEAAGAVALYAAFWRAGVEDGVWSSIFHSISAFCTAGFSLRNDSFESLSGDYWVQAILGTLSYLGAMGFIVCVDCWRYVRGKVRAVTLTTKIILGCTFWMSAIGTALLYLGEPSLRGLAPDQRLLAAFFQCMTAITTVGFNTVGIAGLSKASLLLIIVLMVIGASPSGTGGGVKCTTLSAFAGVMRSAIRGETEVAFWGRTIPLERIWIACASLGLYLSMLVLGTHLLELTEASSFEKNFFEAASALGTVGLSMGITSSLSALGKLIVIALMAVGRLGPMTLGAALFWRRPEEHNLSDADLAV